MKDLQPLSFLSWCVTMAYAWSAGIILGLSGHHDLDGYFLMAWAGLPVMLYHGYLCDRAEGRTGWLN